MAVPIRTAVATLCAGLAASLLSGAPARAGQDPGSAAHVWTVSAPGPGAAAGAPRARLSLDGTTGTLDLSVSRGGRTVIEPSPVGIRTERADLSRGLRFLHRVDRPVDRKSVV